MEKASLAARVREIAEHWKNVGLTETPTELFTIAAELERIAGEVMVAVNSEDWPEMTVHDYREAQKLMRQWAAALADPKGDGK